MKYFFDTEFNDDGRRILLISIGIAAEDGRTYYAEFSNTIDLTVANQWVKEQVVPLLHGGEFRKTSFEISNQIIGFVGHKPEFWGYYSAYDWVALCQLYGPMIDLPKTWPMFCYDLKQFAGNTRLPKQLTVEHHALNDAIWIKESYDWLIDNVSQKLKKEGVEGIVNDIGRALRLGVVTPG